MLKKGIIRALSSAALLKLGDRYFQYSVPIFMLHRFAVENGEAEGHSEQMLEQCLQYLRKRRFNFVSVDDIASAVIHGQQLPARSIAFTLDDGYWDQFAASVDVFAKYDCPATYYVATGFIDGDVWFWDAKVDYIVRNSSRDLADALPELYQRLKLDRQPTLRKQISTIVFSLMDQPLTKIEADIAAYAEAMDVEVPQQAPASYAPATWETLRRAEAKGLKIGAHTYDHPLLSRETAHHSQWEIEVSRDRLAEELDQPSQVFCYPVGRSEDFGEREEKLAKEAGFMGAVSTEPRPVDLMDRSHLFSMPRFGFPDELEDFVQYATWIEALKNKVR